MDLTATETGPAADPHFVVTIEPLLRVHPSFLDRLGGCPQLHRESVTLSLDFFAPCHRWSRMEQHIIELYRAIEDDRTIWSVLPSQLRSS
jgi:hypothetical protein